MAPASKEPGLRRPGDPPARYGKPNPNPLFDSGIAGSSFVRKICGDLYEEWVDDKLEEKKRSKSKLDQDSDYDTDLEELQDSDIEEEDSADEVEVVDKQGRKKKKKKVKLRRWRPENMKEVEFHIGMVFMSVSELRVAIQEYIVQQRVGVHYVKNDLQRKCPKLGRGQHVADAAPPEQEQAVAAAPEAEHVAAPEADHATTPTSPIRELQSVFAGDEYEVHAQPPKKMTVKRNNNNSKKKTLPKPSTSATASLVESAMSYDISSTSVIQILQEQAAATQQSQTPLPGPLPESRFIASCRDDLPPPRSTTATLGLKRRKRVAKKKENMIPKV